MKRFVKSVSLLLVFMLSIGMFTVAYAAGDDAAKADYTEVQKAVDMARRLNSKDYTNYWMLEMAIQSINWDLTADEQDKVDRMAQEIKDTIALLQPVKGGSGTVRDPLLLIVNKNNRNTNKTGEFTDVKEGDWYAEAVKYVAKNGIMTGQDDGTFGPDVQATRAELVQALYNKAGSPNITAATSFGDIERGAPYARAVSWASRRSIANGYGDGKFGPNDLVTREQFAVMFYRFAGSPAIQGSLSAFGDAASVSDYAVTAMTWATYHGIISGIDGNLVPQGNVTRAETATMIMRYSELFK